MSMKRFPSRLQWAKNQANRWPLLNVPLFVAKLIGRVLARNPAERPSIEDIFDEFENDDFRILSSIDSDAVQAVVEGTEQPQTDNETSTYWQFLSDSIW
jgi:hypothetical protein